MYISDKLNLIRKTDGRFEVHFCDKSSLPTDADLLNELGALYDTFRAIPKPQRTELLMSILNNHTLPKLNEYLSTFSETSAQAMKEVSKEEIKRKILRGTQKIMDFFTEFQFEPNFRFMNTLCNELAENEQSGKKYILSYFELTDNPYFNDIREKMKSVEFSNILSDLSNAKPDKAINQRFKLYYGSQGTGKTTIAQKETDDRCIICNSSMLPSDLMEDFDFDEGKATFKKSMLWQCMENGLPLVLDEINLLPFDSLRFLQGILDGKKEFQYKGADVHINDGFCVIGTMNLTVNGMTYGLPEPLIDRCAKMKKFTLTAEQLVNAIS